MLETTGLKVIFGSIILLNLWSLASAGVLGNGELHPIQAKLIEQYHPEPLLDTIREEEKYGNTETHPIGRAVVSKIEVVSNKLTAALQLPGLVKNKTKDAILAKLNNIGGKLVGLEDW